MIVNLPEMIVIARDGRANNLLGGKMECANAHLRSSWRARSVIFLLAIALMVGCGASRPIKYYQLTAPAGTAPATAQTLPLTIIVGLPSAPDLYRDTRVVYAINDQQLGAYQYERWAGPPPQLIQSVFLRTLRASGHYAAADTPQGKADGDYNLSMRIYDFKEQDSAGSLSGRLSMDVELRDLKTGDAVWQHYFTHDEPIAAKTVPEVVAALNKCVQAAANQVAGDMEQYFAAHPPK